MIKKTSKKERIKKRHRRIRKSILGTTTVPRLSFCKSNKHVYVQLIDDVKACTLASCSTLQPVLKKELKSTWTKEAAKKVGELIAKDALSKGIKEVVFDRGGNRYHGKVVSFAESARAGGLKF